jgi:hypothetical protein
MTPDYTEPVTVGVAKHQPARPIRWLREQVTTTPGRLRLASVVLAVGLIVFGVVTLTATTARSDAATAARASSEPLLVSADQLYASMADADTTAAATFLTGADSRHRYLTDLSQASGELTTLATNVGNSKDAATEVAAISRQLPVYSGLIETARANNLQGYPVGAAYQRQASDLMRQKLLVEARQLYELEQGQLASDYSAGSSSGELVAFVLVAVAILALLVVVQISLARRTRRTLNPALVVATVLIVALGAWALAGIVSEQDALSSAQRSGSDFVQVAAVSKILALRAQGDESLALIARGGGELYLCDFDVAANALQPPRNGRLVTLSSERDDCTFGAAGNALPPPGNLLGELTALNAARGSAASARALAATFAQYRAVHGQIVGDENTGNFTGATRLAVGPNASEAGLFGRLDNGLNAQLGAAKARFQRSATDATSALDGLAVAIPVLVVLAALLALFGLQQRIKEYR